MKSVLFLIASSFILLICSCAPDSSTESAASSKRLMQGKWMLDKYVDESYQPANTLISSDERIGLPGDSLIFAADNMLYTYSDVDADFVEDYQLLDHETVRIEFEDWKIAKLTSTELYLLSDEADALTNERTVVRIFLKRP